MSVSEYRAASGRRAIVIGGGIAGLLAARVLIKHFERVTLIERDQYPDEPVFRSGVPQGRHLHVLYLRGQQILEQLFPGIKEKLVKHGAVESDFTNDYVYRFRAGWLPRTPSRLQGYTCTRLLLEWQIRQEVQAYQAVEIIQGHEVTGLVASDDLQSIGGVRLRARGPHRAGEPQEHHIHADLVVDASGRLSQAPRWLEALGYPSPQETVVNAFLGYATRVYRPPVDPTRTWKGMLIQSNPPTNLRTGFVWPVEGERWMVLLVGAGKDYPPTQDADFLAFAKGLSDPLLYQVIKDADPLSPVYSYRRTENRLRHFERLKRYPERFMVLGDACCALNPIYGQGMTVVASGIMVLDELLGRHRSRDLKGLSAAFQRKLARVNALPWQLATGSDYLVPETEGGSPGWMNRLQQRYMDVLIDLMPTDDAIRDAFLEVLHLLRSPAAILNPVFFLKALRYGRRSGKNEQVPFPG